jgi:Ig domain of plant-specific actin-binding protein
MSRRLIPVAIAAAALLVPVAAAGPQAAPQNTGEPVVSGKTVQGETLTTTNGRWTGSSPLTFRYRWLRCDTSGGGVNGVNCATIPGETRRTHILSGADVGHRIRSRVIASNAEGTASANSNATPGVVQPSSTAGRPVNQTQPTISGTPQQNSTLTANPGTWSGGKPQTYTYQWRRCDSTGGSCADISGATAQTYVLKDVDVGRTLRVRVTAKNSLGSRAATSTPSAVIQKAGAPSGSTVLVSDVALPNRLVIDRVQFSPTILRSRRPVVARFRVTDLQNHPVQGALVLVVGIPFGNMTTPREQATGPDGYVTFVMRPTSRLHLSSAGSQPFFVRARKAGDRLIAGVSVRRLVNLSIRAR